MATRISSERPKVTRVVAARPHYAHKVREIVVSVLFTPQGGMLELRALKYRQRFTIMVDKLFDQLMLKDAMQKAREARERRRKRK